MFDVTINQMQNECINYLATINELKEQVAHSEPPVTESQIEALAVHQAEMEKLYESMIGSLEEDNSQLQNTLMELQNEVDRLLNKNSKKCNSSVGTDGHKMTNQLCGSDEAVCVTSKAVSTDETSMSSIGIETGEDFRITEMKSKLDTMEQQLSDSGSEKHKLSNEVTSLSSVNDNLQIKLDQTHTELLGTKQQLSTMEKNYKLLLDQNQVLKQTIAENREELSSLTSTSECTRQQLTQEIDNSHSRASHLMSELNVLQQQLAEVRSENAVRSQKEVELNATITKLTSERSNIQSKVNMLNSELMQQKSLLVSQNMKLKQLDVTNDKLERQIVTFKSDSMELYEQLESAKQQKDVLADQLSSLQDELTSSVKSWQEKLTLKEAQQLEVSVLM